MKALRIGQRAGRRAIVTVFLATAAWLSAASPAHAQVATSKAKSAGVAFVTKMSTGEYADAASMAAPSVATALTEQTLRGLWLQLTAAGAFRSVVADAVSESGAFTLVDVTMQFSSAVRARIAMDSLQRVTGFFMLPSPKSASRAYVPPEYVDTTKFEEVDIRLSTRVAALPGVLTLPRGVARAPVVVLVHGSGPNDRDESIGPNRPFRDLAWGLASQGIAVLRYDKRSFVAPGLMDANTTVEEEVILDALTALDSARAHPRIEASRVFLLGHSLGGMLGPEIASRDRELAGAIILAGTPRQLAEVMIEQYQYLGSLPSNAGEEAQTHIATARVQLERLIRHEPAATDLVMGIQASYFYDLSAREPLPFARALTIPVLYLQGGRDYQVTTQDLELWRTGLKDSKTSSFKLYPDLNHLFATGTGKATPAEYLVAGHVAAEVIRDLVEFVRK